MDFEGMGYQFRFCYGRDKKMKNTYVHLSVADPTGKEVGSLIVHRAREIPGYEGTSRYKYDNATIEVHPDLRGKGLGSEMWQRLTNAHPNMVISHSDFSSEEGLRAAQRAHALNPKQHLLNEHDAVVDEYLSFNSRYA